VCVFVCFCLFVFVLVSSTYESFRVLLLLLVIYNILLRNPLNRENSRVVSFKLMVLVIVMLSEISNGLLRCCLIVVSEL
jgi:hypothetical protein